MKKNLIYAAIVAASAGLTLACTSSYTESTNSVQGESQSGGMPKVSDYPETKTVTQQDNYHGTVVSDAYRWLEEEKRTTRRLSHRIFARSIFLLEKV